MQDIQQPVRLRFSIDLNYEVQEPAADFIFNIQPAHTRAQRVVHEELQVNQPVRQSVYTDRATRSRFLRLNARGGPLSIQSVAVVDENGIITCKGKGDTHVVAGSAHACSKQWTRRGFTSSITSSPR